jgi:hypothetical protein
VLRNGVDLCLDVSLSYASGGMTAKLSFSAPCLRRGKFRGNDGLGFCFVALWPVRVVGNDQFAGGEGIVGERWILWK